MRQRRRFLKEAATAVGGVCFASAYARGAEGKKESEKPSETLPDLGELVARYFHQTGRS
jgi:hypothetical protein